MTLSCGNNCKPSIIQLPSPTKHLFHAKFRGNCFIHKSHHAHLRLVKPHRVTSAICYPMHANALFSPSFLRPETIYSIDFDGCIFFLNPFFDLHNIYIDIVAMHLALYLKGYSTRLETKNGRGWKNGR